LDVRVGVFVCHCGTNIGGVVNVPEVVEYARKLDGVVLADEGNFLCSVDYLSKIKDFIAEHNLNRIVVASCTPRTHEPTFRSTLKEAGLNPYLLEFVSIREQCSWVHKSHPLLATEKAEDLVKMGVAKARLLEPSEEIRIPVGKECSIIGGGMAGMTAALALSDRGFKVKLMEKNERLGGLLNNLHKVAPTDEVASGIIKDKINSVTQHKNIEVYTKTKIEDVKGYVGNFKIKVRKDALREEFGASTIIVATGMREIEPTGLYGYGNYPKVVTLLQFEELLKTNGLKGVDDIVIINCVNSRNDERGCCNIGCLASIKSAKCIKDLNKDTNVYILYRDMSIKGMEELYFKDAVEKFDIKLIRYSDTSKPKVYEAEGKLTVKVYDILLGGDVKINADLIVLTTALQGDSTAERLKGLLKVSTNPDGFFQEAHIKLRPIDFATDGMYVGGCARSPKGVRETVKESLGAAMRAAILMRRGYVEGEGIVADIKLEKCLKCGLCAEICPFGAIEIVDKEPRVIKALCKGCGMCAADCPQDAITMIHFTDEQILAQVEAALAEKPNEKIVAFCCHWCALGAVDVAGVSRFEYPPNIRIIRVMCAGRVDPAFVCRAFELGAAGVLVAGCEFPTCYYMTGNYRCRDDMERVRKVLAKKGVSPGKLWTVWLSAADGPKFAATVRDMVKQLKLG